MKNIFQFFNLLSLVLLFIVSVIHIRFNLYATLTRRLTSLFLFSIFFGTLVPFLIYTGAIMYVPHLYRTGTIMALLAAPLMYLITITAINGRRLKWVDLLHFIPVVFYLINFAGFFILSTNEKLRIIQGQSVASALYSYSEGLLISGEQMGNIRMLQVLFYLVLTVRAVVIQKNELSQWKDDDFDWRPVILQFLLFISLYLLPYVLKISELVSHPEVDTNQLSFSMANLVLTIFFLSNPELLYGFKVLKKYNVVVGNEVKEKTIVVSDAEFSLRINELAQLRIQRRIEKIRSHLSDTKAYLGQEFSLTVLERDLGISGKLISNTIKEGTGLNFSSFINEMRISYVLNQFKENVQWRNYTVEFIASQIGYKSATSFYNNFKEITGKTPREYIESLG